MIRTGPFPIGITRRWKVVVSYYGFKLVMAIVLALPVSSAVWSTGITQWPGGDQVLFEPGGGLLAELVYRQPWLWRGALTTSVCLALLGSLAALGAVIAVMVALSSRTHLRFASMARRSVEHFWPVTVLAAVTLLAQGAIGLGALRIMPVLGPGMRTLVGERNGDLLLLGLALLAGSAVLGLGVLQDLARAMVIRWRAPVGTALWSAIRLTRTRLGELLAVYVPRALWTVALWMAAAAAVTSVSVDRPGTWRVVLTCAVHQIAYLGLLWIRVDWLERVLSLAAKSPEGGQTPA